MLFAEWLAKRDGIARVALCGHSEGSLLASIAAKQTKAVGVVSLAGAGRRLDTVLLEQLSRAKLPPELAEKAKLYIAELMAGRHIAQPDPALGALFRPSVQPFLISTFAHDPAVEMASCKCPVFIAGGGSDAQILRADFDALMKARPDATSLWLPAMTHALLDTDPAATPLAQPLAAGLVEAVTGFLQKLT